MVLAFRAEQVDRTRRCLSQRPAGLNLAVQEAERVAVQPLPAVGAELIVVASVVGFKLVDKGGAADRVTDVVDEQADVREAQGVHETPGQLDDFGIHRRVGVANDLDAKLMVLAEPAGLGAFVAENRTEIVHADGLGQVVHPVLQVGAAHRRGAFGTQRQVVAPPVLEGVHLLFNDVGAFPDGADEQPGILEGRTVDASIAKALSNLGGLGLDVAPILLLLGQQVGGAPGGAELGHGTPDFAYGWTAADGKFPPVRFFRRLLIQRPLPGKDRRGNTTGFHCLGSVGAACWPGRRCSR